MTTLLTRHCIGLFLLIVWPFLSIKSGKIQGATPSDAQKIPYNGKKESNAVNSQKSHRDQHVGAVLISGSVSHQQQQRGNQQRPDEPKIQFTNINMPLSQALQHLFVGDESDYIDRTSSEPQNFVS